MEFGEVRTKEGEEECDAADSVIEAVIVEVLGRHSETVEMEWREGRLQFALRAVIWRLGQGSKHEQQGYKSDEDCKIERGYEAKCAGTQNDEAWVRIHVSSGRHYIIGNESVDFASDWTRKLATTMHSSKNDLDECGMISGRSSYTMVSNWVAVMGIMRKSQTRRICVWIRSGDEETESSHRVDNWSESVSKRFVIAFTGHVVACEDCKVLQALERRRTSRSDVVRSNLTVHLNLRCGS